MDGPFSNIIDESEKADLEIGMRCTKCCRFFISNLLFYTSILSSKKEFDMLDQTWAN